MRAVTSGLVIVNASMVLSAFVGDLLKCGAASCSVLLTFYCRHEICCVILRVSPAFFLMMQS